MFSCTSSRLFQNQSRGFCLPNQLQSGSGQSHHDEILNSITPDYSYSQSFKALVEMVTQDPVIQSCLRVIISTCLARGIKIRVGGMDATKEFDNHIQQYYIPFCENSIRSMFLGGFVPWRLRKSASGDVVPEVLPIGSYSWIITENRQQHHAHSQDHQSSRLASRVPGEPRGSAASAGSQQGGGWTTKTMFKAAARPSSRSGTGGGRYAPYHTHAEVNTLRGDSGRGKQPPSSSHKTLPSTLMDEDDKTGLIGKDARLGYASNNRLSNSQQPPIYMRQQAALKRQGVPLGEHDSKILRYQIRFVCRAPVDVDEVEIYEFFQPNYNTTLTSPIMSTPPSPLSHLIIDYTSIRRAQMQREYADQWNCKAKMVCSYQPPHSTGFTLNEGAPIIAGNDWGVPQNRSGLESDSHLPVDMECNAYTRDAIMENIVSSKHDSHRPVIYTMPKNTRLEGVPKLDLIQDIFKMHSKFAKDISSLMGIPFEMLGGGYSANEGHKKSMDNTRIFTTNMMSVCKHLQRLVGDVYIATYGGDPADVEVTISPTPRIEINSVDDIVKLMELGIVSFDNAIHVSNMLLGIELKHGAGVDVNAGQFSRAFITPSHKRDLITAQESLLRTKNQR